MKNKKFPCATLLSWDMQEMQENLKNSAVQLETCTPMQSEWLWASQVMNGSELWACQRNNDLLLHPLTRGGSYWLLLLGDQLDKGRWQSSHTNDSNNKKISSNLEQMLLNSESFSPQKYIRIILSTLWWMYSSDKKLSDENWVSSYREKREKNKKEKNRKRQIYIRPITRAQTKACAKS